MTGKIIQTNPWWVTLPRLHRFHLHPKYVSLPIHFHIIYIVDTPIPPGKQTREKITCQSMVMDWEFHKQYGRSKNKGETKRKHIKKHTELAMREIGNRQ
jgi:hypothetical protein